MKNGNGYRKVQNSMIFCGLLDLCLILLRENYICIYMNNYVDSFNEYLSLELHYSERTVKTYSEALKEYQNFLDEHHYSFLAIQKDQANQYKAYLIKKNYENKTSSLYLSAVRSFYYYLVEIQVVNVNPFIMIHNPKVVKNLPNFLNHSESD